VKPQNYIIKYLDEGVIMQLATVSGEQPWVVNVHYAVDNQHYFYWTSHNERRHSQELVKNPHVAATVHLPYSLGQPQMAVYLEGDARVVAVEEVENLFQAYAEKFGSQAMVPDLLDPANGQTLYQLQPRTFVLWDPANFPDNPRQEWVPSS
jgi:uncharacterized protein YhbP (UPF0306 family)